MTMKFDDVIEFPNGMGFTPCTREYAEVCEAMATLKPDRLALDDLSPADYQRWNELDDKRTQLMLSGHVGKSVRY